VYAAPFQNARAKTAKLGMELSYAEICKLLKLMGNERFQDRVFKGSETPLTAENIPVVSDAAQDLVLRAKAYTAEKPLYVIAVAALTNIASALLLDPTIAEKIVVVWLGGNTPEFGDAWEFNLFGDLLAAKVVFDKMQGGLVQVPCWGCVSAFSTTEYELTHYLLGKNALCDYLVGATLAYHESVKDQVWSKPIWDVTAVAWLLNDEKRFMRDRYAFTPQVTAKGEYKNGKDRGQMKYVYHIERDALYADLFKKLSDERNFICRE
jgi:inosine-uridine nucleoside N-ribohydrolase